MKKLEILSSGAKYDAACTSSGGDRKNNGKGMGSTISAGCCHSFTPDGRCISLLKVLYTNYCIYDCKYCVNRRSNDVERTAFTPDELSELTIQFYRRNYIEGLFLSSGIIKNPDFTMEQIIKTLELIRYKHNFWGYIHAKTIPGASSELVNKLGLLADRLSVNIELPSEVSLNTLAPHKTKQAILTPMKQISTQSVISKNEIVKFKNAPRFASAGQATQMIIGATPETDYKIIKLSSALYEKYALKRVFYSAYIPAVEDSLLPAVDTKPPLLREHRLYQADWLMRMYNFSADEILSEKTPGLNPYLDPKCNWAINNFQVFPVDINKASLDDLLRVPGIGPTSARRIVVARKHSRLGMAELKKLGVVLKRARYFIITSDNLTGTKLNREATTRALIDPGIFAFGMEQVNFFDAAKALPKGNDVKSLNEAVEEAVICLSKSLLL